MAQYKVEESSLTAVADALREASGTSGELEFPNEYVSMARSLGGGSSSAVLYTAQELTEEQKAQARENIGAASAEAIGTATVDGRIELTDCRNGDISISSWTIPSGITEMTVTARKRNLLNPIYIAQSIPGGDSTGGLTIVMNGNTAIINGTATSTRYCLYVGGCIYGDGSEVFPEDIILPAGTYYFSGCPAGGGSSTYRIQWKNKTTDAHIGYDDGNGFAKTFTEDTALKANIIVYSGYTCENLAFNLQIVAGNNPVEFEVYQGNTVTITADSVPPVRGLKSFIGYTAVEVSNGGSATVTYSLPDEESRILNELSKQVEEMFVQVDDMTAVFSDMARAKHQDDAEFTVTMLNNSNQFSQNDITFVGDELWVSKENATYYTNGTMIFRYKVVGNEFTLVGTCDCDFGHLNTMDYCATNDCLIFGNGGNGTETTGNYFVIVKNPRALGSSALIADVGIKYDADIGYKVQALWGGSNLGDNNIVYLLSNNAAKITKVLLLKGDDGEFNGEFVTLEAHDLEAWGVQGADIFGDTLYIGGQLNSNEYAAVKEISLSDYTTVRTVKQKFYSADGTAITGCVQGIYVNRDAVWLCVNTGDTTKPVCLTKYNR